MLVACTRPIIVNQCKLNFYFFNFHSKQRSLDKKSEWKIQLQITEYYSDEWKIPLATRNLQSWEGKYVN
jgi:hypothetical protein